MPSKISSRPLLEPLNVHLPFMQNYLAGTLQLAGALAAQGSLDRAVAKATEGETLGLLCASRDPLWEARTHALIASSMWATTKRLEQTFSELVPVRRAILRKRAVEAEGAPQRRPTTSRPIPDTSEDDATVGLRERLRGIIRRLLAAVRAQIVLSNDHESIQDLLVTLSEVHRFAALNLPAEAKEGKGGDGEAKDDGEDAPVRRARPRECEKAVPVLFAQGVPSKQASPRCGTVCGTPRLPWRLSLSTKKTCLCIFAARFAKGKRCNVRTARPSSRTLNGSSPRAARGRQKGWQEGWQKGWQERRRRQGGG